LLAVKCIGAKACPIEPTNAAARDSRYSPLIDEPSTDTPGLPNLHSN
jgi:hypothetical protein